MLHASHIPYFLIRSPLCCLVKVAMHGCFIIQFSSIWLLCFSSVLILLHTLLSNTRRLCQIGVESLITIEVQWSLYVPPGLTHTNSMFCPHSAFMCFVRIWEQTAIISLYSINWLVFITETEGVYWAIRTGCLYIIQVMCFVWIWEQTAIISLYSINWLVCITETECLLRGTDWVFIYNWC